MQKTVDDIEMNKPLFEAVTLKLSTDCIPNSFIACLIGKPGSGKTTYLRTVLTNPNLYLGKFDYVYIISPSIAQYRDICDEKQMNPVLDIKWIADKINTINKNDKDKSINILFVLDDVISQVKDLSKNDDFISFFLNRRHICWNGTVSIFLVAQKYTMVPCKLRSNITWLVLFNMSQIDIDKIREEHVVAYNKKQWLNAFQVAYKNQYGFIQFDVENKLIFHKFKKMEVEAINYPLFKPLINSIKSFNN